MSKIPSHPSTFRKPNLAVLESRWLHNFFLFFSAFDRALPLVNWLRLLVIVALNYGLWHVVSTGDALKMTAVLAAVMLFDISLLWQLPRRKISFGRVPSQFAVMVLPRLGIVVLGLSLAYWWPVVATWGVVGFQLLGTIIYLWALLIEPHQLALTTLKVASPHLPAGAPPIRLLHLSDLHLERLTRREERMLSLIKAAQPDLIVITGDYLNLSYRRDPEAIGQVRSLLSKIKAPFGVYATLGSPTVDAHDVAPYHFTHSHIRLLRDDVVELDLGLGRRLTLLGMDCTHDMAYDARQFSKLESRRNGRATTALLYHSPELMPVVQKYSVDLFLCGHTHGGQVRLPVYGALITSASTGKRYEMGRYDENGTILYVSRGVGLEGLCAPRLRLFCPPEMTLVLLENNNTP